MAAEGGHVHFARTSDRGCLEELVDVKGVHLLRGCDHQIG
jgi:hypothetical protein